MQTPSFGIYANQNDKRWNTFIEEMNDRFEDLKFGKIQQQVTNNFFGINLDFYLHATTNPMYFQTIITLDDYFAEGSVYRILTEKEKDDWTPPTIEQAVEYLREKYLIDSSGESHMINMLIGFYDDINKSQPFKRGDRILVWDEDNAIRERIALCYINKACKPVIVVQSYDEHKFFDGSEFFITTYKHWKPLPKENPERQKLQQEIEQLEKELEVKRDKLSGL